MASQWRWARYVSVSIYRVLCAVDCFTSIGVVPEMEARDCTA